MGASYMFNLIIHTSPTVLEDTGLTQAQLDQIILNIELAAELWGRYIDATDANIDLDVTFSDLPGNTLGQAGAYYFSTDGVTFLSEVTEELNGRPDSGGAASYGNMDANLALDLPNLLDSDFYFFSENLDFISNPGAAGQIDFLTLIVHELGHALGFDTTAFEEFVVGSEFTGPNAVAANGGNNVQLDGGNHLVGPDLLDTTISNNSRDAINAVHLGIYQDLGLPIVAASEDSDVLYGFNLQDDSLAGLGGSDVLFGLTGDDQLLGDAARSLSLESAEGQLFRAFQAVFDRNPDEGGFNAFLTEMRLGNATQETVIDEFVTSAEFQNTYGTLSNQEFVEQLYRNVLDREGDTDGIAAFTASIDGGASRASVVTEFANSAEFVQLMTLPSASFATNVIINPAEAQVFRIYQAVFLRDPDEGGFTAFTNSLQAGVQTTQAITAEFVGSEEFQNTYGSLDNAGFVELLFTNVLPGNTDTQGRADFTEALDAGALTRADMVAEFVDSFEFVQRMESLAAEFVAGTFTSSGDTLDGGMGNDIMFGGRGADSFAFDTQDGGADIVLDFTSGTDTLDLGAHADFDSFSEIMAVGSQVGLNTVFDFGDGNTLTLENVILADLTEADFGLLVG